MTKYDIYANVRRIRQAVGDRIDAGDFHMEKAGNNDWDSVWSALNNLECKLERMDLQEANHD